MRIILVILASISFLSPEAQTHLPVNHLNFVYTPWLFTPDYNYNQIADSTHTDHKWHFSKYAGLSAGYGFFAGGTSFLSAPFGLQLTRPLNNNIYAFAGISSAPSFFSINRLLTAPALNSSYPGMNHSNAYGFGLNPGIEAGLMYINDAKTFSISGSIGVERDSYPIYPSNGMNTKKQ